MKLPIIARGMCESCYRRIAKQGAKRECPGCGQKRLIRSPLGLCDRCATRTLFKKELCTGCGRHARIVAHGLCAPCRLRPAEPCPSCREIRVLHPEMNLCCRCLPHLRSIGTSCVVCGQPGRVPHQGMCSRCRTHDPDWPFEYGERLIARLEAPPEWLEEFVDYAAARFCPQRAMKLLHELGRLLSAGPSAPAHLLERATKPGRHVGALALALEGFFVERRLALPLDHTQRRTRASLERVIEGVPIPFRDAVTAFCEVQLGDRQRALRVGTKPLSERSVVVRLSAIRDFAHFLVERRPRVDRWELVGKDDVEHFLATSQPNSRTRLPAVRAFFRWARSRKLVLIDPTHGLKSHQSPGYRGKLVDHQTQSSLYRRWIGTDVHPNEAFVGLMALLHGASVSELRYLLADEVDARAHAIRLKVPPPPGAARSDHVGRPGALPELSTGPRHAESAPAHHLPHRQQEHAPISDLHPQATETRGCVRTGASLHPARRPNHLDRSQTCLGGLWSCSALAPPLPGGHSRRLAACESVPDAHPNMTVRRAHPPPRIRVRPIE
jgi:hypothetical protein